MYRFFKRSLFAAVAVIALGAATGAVAQTPGVDFTTPTIDFTNGQWVLGFQFHANANTNVTHLGFYDDLKDGLTERHQVGLWDSVGTLLASTVVSNSDPLVSWWRWSAIAPVALVAGNDYVVGATSGGENYTWAPTGFTTDPSISFVQDRYTAGNSLAFPNNTGATAGAPGIFGGNVAVSAVPEGSSVAMLACGLLPFGFVLRRRLRK